MIETPEVPEVPEQHQPEPGGERGRMSTLGHRIDDGSTTILLVVHEVDGSWTVHGLGAVGIRLTRQRAVALAQAILRSDRDSWGAGS